MKTTIVTFSDDELATFVDGQADAVLVNKILVALKNDPDLVMRVDAMTAYVAAVQDAFELEAVNAPEIPPHLVAHGVKPTSRLIAGMAIAASFAAGVVVMNFVRPSPDWIDRVASYQALYVTETLRGDTQDAALTQVVLRDIRQRLDIDLAAAPALTGMSFKRAQTLAIEGEPLIQFAYLADGGTPFALCMMRVSQDDRQLSTSRTQGLATASWINDGVGYVLIGGSDIETVSNLAADLTDQI